jgi:hypothetical protein
LADDGGDAPPGSNGGLLGVPDRFEIPPLAALWIYLSMGLPCVKDEGRLFFDDASLPYGDVPRGIFPSRPNMDGDVPYAEL